MSNPLQNKMYDFEVKPPQDLWDKIVSELNEKDEAYEFSSKLYNHEAIPPSAAWQQIKDTLEKNSEAPNSKRKPVFYLFRYAAAIVIVALMVFGGIRFFKNNSSKEEFAVNKNRILKKDSMTPSAPESTTATPLNVTSTTNEKSDDEALEESKRTVASNEFYIRKRLKIARDSYLSAPAHYIENISNPVPELHFSDIIQPSFAIQSSTEDLSDRYIMLKSPDGNFFRMSKKLADLICCITGEDQDAGCKNQLQQWREKIASSSLAPAPGNFLDILSLITSLQNDKN